MNVVSNEFSRAATSRDIGAKVRALRSQRAWSQAKLATMLGINRATILRLEAGRHLPASSLVQDLEHVFDLRGGTLQGETKTPSGPSARAHGGRARQIRKERGLTLAEVAKIAGVSEATLSRFERMIGGTRLLLSLRDQRSPIVSNDAYALALGFDSAAALQRHLHRRRP